MIGRGPQNYGRELPPWSNFSANDARSCCDATLSAKRAIYGSLLQWRTALSLPWLCSVFQHGGLSGYPSVSLDIALQHSS